MPGEDKIAALHAAAAEHFDVGTLDDFKQKLQDPAKRKTFYDAASKEFDLGDYPTFEQKVALKKKQISDSQLPLESTQGSVQQPSLLEGGASGLTSTPSVSQSNQTPNDFGDFNKGLLGNKTQQVNIPVAQPKSITAGQEVPEGNLMSATSSAETTAKDQSNYSQEIQKKGLLKGDITESFMRGTANLGSSVLKTPAFLYDIATAMQHPEVKKALDKIHMGSSSQIGDVTGIHNVMANELDEAVSHSQKIFQEKYDKPVTEYISNGDYEKAFGLMANSVAESAPAMIAIAIGGAGGMSMLETTMAGTGVFGANKMSQLEKENPEMDHASKVANAMGTGALEGITEALPIGKISSLTKNILLKSGEEAAMEFAKQGFIKTAGKAMARYFGVQSTEALSEMANQFGENVLDKLTGAKPDVNLTDGVVDAGILGFGTGVAMTGPTSALELVKTRKAVKKAGELADQKKSLEADLASPNVSEDIKNNLSEKIKDISEEETHLANEEKQKFNDLPEDKKVEVDNLLTQAKKISDTVVDPTISEQTREVMKKDHDDIEKNIDKIYEESEKLKTEKAKESQTHEEWMKSFESDLLPAQEKAVSTEEIAPKPENKTELSTIDKIKKSVDLFYQAKEAKGASKKRTIANERKALLEENPNIKYIDDNITNINKQLEEKELLTKEGDCP